MKIESIILESEFVRLEPLSSHHKEGLCDAIADGELWNLFVTIVPPLDKVDDFLNNAKKDYDAGVSLAFATIDKRTNKVAGSTRFMKVDLANKKVEIGYTFLGKSWQRTRVNTEAKLLMLTHAFEVLDVNRVEFLTDYLNHSSRQAILRLGAKEEGIIRSHRVTANGRVRDSTLYSIIKNEWAGVKQHLSSKLS